MTAGDAHVDNGNWPIDNNACENTIRPFVVGRRNWSFVDTVAGAEASANLYLLLQTCKANGIDGYAHLQKLLVELPKVSAAEDYEALLTWSIGIAAKQWSVQARGCRGWQGNARALSIDRLRKTARGRTGYPRASAVRPSHLNVSSALD